MTPMKDAMQQTKAYLLNFELSIFSQLAYSSLSSLCCVKVKTHSLVLGQY